MRTPATPSDAPALAIHHASQVALVAALSATTMLFASLVSAYLVRRSFADWGNPALAAWPMALLACAILASVAMEGAVRDSSPTRSSGLFGVGIASTAYLLIAVAVVIRTVQGEGIAAPHNAFVVLLLSLHVVHALVGATFAAVMLRSAPPTATSTALGQVRLLTHFLTALLVGILFLLFGLR